MAWYDDLNKGTFQSEEDRPGSVRALRAAMQAQQAAQKPETPKSNIGADLLPTAGGIGGALGGAALGASIGSVVPGIGTAIGGLAGGILGGALGSGGGQAAKNVAIGEKDVFKDVGQEALLGGLLSAPPLRLARGLGAAGKAAASQGAKGTAKGAFEQAFIGAPKQAVRGGTERTSQGLLGEAWGIRTGVKTSGVPVTPQRAQELQRFTTTVIGVPKTSSADMVFERAVNYQKQTGDAIGSAIKAIPENAVDVKGLSTKLSTKFNSLIGVDANNQVAKDILSQVNAAKTPQELWTLRKAIDNELINFSRNPQSVTPGAEQVARAARNEISAALSKAAPGIRNLNKDYSNVIDVMNLTADAARTPKGFAIPGFQQRIGGATAQRVRAGAGNLTGGAASAGQATSAALPSGIVPTTLRQGVGQAVFGAKTPAPLDETLMQQSPDQFGAAPIEQPVQENPYPRENLMYDIQRDPDNADKYIAYFQNLQEVFASQEPQLTSTQATRAAAAQNALQDIPLIQDAITSGKLGAAKAIPGAGTPLGRSILGTENLDAALFNIADNILRARSGAAAPEAEVLRFVNTFLPGPLDSEEAKKQKLERAVRELQGYVNPMAASAGTLEEALMAQQQGGF